MTIAKAIIAWLITQRNMEQEQVLIVASLGNAYAIIHAKVLVTFFSDLLSDCMRNSVINCTLKL